MELKEFWMLIREALLLILDALERMMGTLPTTSQIRKEWKRNRR